MTHLENIPHVLKNGITHKNSESANPHYISIGDSSLIDTREGKFIHVTNGQTGYSFVKTITVGDFIPFYFGYRMPMLFVIQKGYNGVSKQAAQNIIYCVINIQKVIDNKLPFYFTDGHATDSFSTCYDETMIGNVSDIVDFDAAFETDWTKERDLKRKKEAEFLILGNVPKSCVLGYICFNEVAKNRLLALGIATEQIAIRPKYYF